MTTRGQLIYPGFTDQGLLIPQTCSVDSCNQVSIYFIFKKIYDSVIYFVMLQFVGLD